MCGLIHIPLMTEFLKPDAPPRPTLPRSMIVEAVELCLNECERIAGGMAGKPRSSGLM
jgi:hypothetical protein